MRFGFSMNAFRQHELREGIEVLAVAGYDGIEILLDEPHLVPEDASRDDLERIDGWLTDNDLSVSNCNAFMLHAIERSAEAKRAEYERDTEVFHHPSFIEPVERDRLARVEHTKRALETAASLGADSISIQPGGPIPRGTSKTDALDTFVHGVRKLVETAERTGVDLLVEPEPKLLIETSHDFLEFIDRIDSPAVGCNFDAGHFYSAGEDPAELVEVLEPYSPHYHIEDIPADRTHEHTQLGEGSLDIDGFLEAVEQSGYDGFVTVELYPYEETAPETAHTAMKYLREHDWV